MARDVCDVLGLGNGSQALSYLDEDEKGQVNGGVITNDPRLTSANVNVISEPGLYSLILRSRKERAREFKRWVVHEVLPTIRKTGGDIHQRYLCLALRASLTASHVFPGQSHQNRQITSLRLTES